MFKVISNDQNLCVINVSFFASLENSKKELQVIKFTCPEEIET
jgi:hypothetical protein